MADFRKLFYALAVVALLAGLTVPASAQNPPFSCNTSVSVAPIVRAEGYTEHTGDLVLNCTGGVPTTVGQPVPQVNITIFLNTNITSRVLAANLFDEALLLIDEPNSPLKAPQGLTPNAILNCGNAGANDGGPSGPGVCSIFGTDNPIKTYDGTGGVSWDPGNAACTSTTNTCNGTNAYAAVAPSQGTCLAAVPGTGVSGSGLAPSRLYPGFGSPNISGLYGCGRPNVFQGRLGTAQNAGQLNAVTFLGVPLDPPGTTTSRTIRITDVRANAVAIGVSTTFTTAQIQANISINGPTTVTVSNPQQIVAYVNRGLSVEIPTNGLLFVQNVVQGGTRLRNRLDFIQCVSENPDLFLGTPSPNFLVPPFLGVQGANFTNGLDNTPMVRFREGFASSWKTKNISFTIGTATTAGNANFSSSTSAYFYNGNRSYPGDLAQNVPGAVYNTETGGFMWDGSVPIFATPLAVPPTNPPPGFGVAPGGSTQGISLKSVAANLNGLNTGINSAGIANSGTRLSLLYNNIPSGASVFVPPVLYLFRQGSPYESTPGPDPTSRTGNTGFAADVAGNSGVMVLTSTDSAGAGAFVRTAGTTPAANEFRLQKVAGNLAVYEILYSDPFASELVDVPSVVSYSANINQNLPTPGTVTTVTGGFAPFYSSTAAGQPTPNAQFSTPTHIPRFTPGTGPLNLFLINKCACNLLFPYVVSAFGFDTGIAIANTSADPGAQYGFFGVPQPGRVTFWYYGIMSDGGAVPGQQTSKSVPSGQVLGYVLSSGSPDWGLDGRANKLIGYIITQAEFQYCHAFAYISALGAGPLTPGTSEGYLGIVLDPNTLNRTNQGGENKAH